jgi:class 3 adenylate cyclase
LIVFVPIFRPPKGRNGRNPEARGDLGIRLVGYSRLAGADEDRILARLRALRSDLIDPIISVHHGRIVKRTGDGSIIEFRSVVDAVRCAIEVQSGMVERNAGLPPEKRIEFRIGIHQTRGPMRAPVGGRCISAAPRTASPALKRRCD